MNRQECREGLGGRTGMGEVEPGEGKRRREEAAFVYVPRGSYMLL